MISAHRSSFDVERAEARGNSPAAAFPLHLCAAVRHCSPVPHRERYLFVCTNRRADGDPKGSCAAKGAEAVATKLKIALKARGVALSVRACSSSCLDLCETGISVVQEPDHVAYGGVTIDDVDAIADAAARGAIVERLVVHRGAPSASIAGSTPVAPNPPNAKEPAR